MILITMHASTYRLEATGHAGYAEKGKDIVCSAVTAVCDTLARFVERTAKKSDVRMEEGSILVKATPPSRYRALTGLFYRAIAEELAAIADEYPDNVHFDFYD